MTKDKFAKSAMASEVVCLQQLERLRQFLIDYNEIGKAAKVADVMTIMRFDVTAILLKNPGWPSY